MKRSALLLVISFQLLTFKAWGDTVVGIHGLLSTAHSMKLVRNTLDACGLDVYLWEYESRRKFIKEHACDLLPLLQEIACNCPGRPIHFVTHSIGALVLRAALNMPDCPAEAKIGRAVLLAPPNQGSCLARYFCDFTPIAFAMGERSGWELMHYDPWQIKCYGEFPSCMSVLVIAGCQGKHIWFTKPNDGFITIEETWLNTPYYFLCFRATHGNLLTKPEVLCRLRNF